MVTAIWIGTVLVVVAALWVPVLAGWRAYRKYRGTRVITCPETDEPAAVEVDVGRVVLTAARGETNVRLRACSRWPERRDCGQWCLDDIEMAPYACLARTMLEQFYRDKPCALCGHAIGEIEWFDHRPGLLSPERRTVAWHEVAAQTLPDVLATHLPVCWNCHVAESFRRQYPELVIDRPASRQSA
jgi:hypothetical protein